MGLFFTAGGVHCKLSQTAGRSDIAGLAAAAASGHSSTDLSPGPAVIFKITEEGHIPEGITVGPVPRIHQQAQKLRWHFSGA